MRITTRNEEGLLKVFMDNTYVGYYEDDVSYVFDANNQAECLFGTLSAHSMVGEYLRLRNKDKKSHSIIGFLAAELATHDPNSPAVKQALEYLK